MILTLTANPSLDRTIELGSPLAHGAVQRAVGAVQDPGGKGVNIFACLTYFSDAYCCGGSGRGYRPRADRPCGEWRAVCESAHG